MKSRWFLLVLLAMLVSVSSSYGQQEGRAIEVPRLGLVATDVTALMARQAGLDRIKGCFVQSVASGSPAAAAGLRPGDIIVSLNDRGIRNARELKNDAAGLETGEVGKMCVVRDDYRTTLYVAPAEAPPYDLPSETAFWLGVDVTNVRARSTESLRLQEAGKEGGVLVENVIPGSPADRVGIRSGDVIMSFNSRKVRTVKELHTDLAGAQAGAGVRICIMRGDIRKTLYPVLGRRPDPSYGLTSHEDSASAQTLLAKAQLATVFPEASRFSRYLQPVPHYRAYSPAGKYLGVAFVTTEICPDDSQGYQGPIATLVGISLEGRIVGVHLLEHWESPKYTKNHLDEFVEQYPGRDASGPFVLGRDIDAISGATVSCSAINHSIAVGSVIILASVLNTRGPAVEGGQSGVTWLDQLRWQPDSILLPIVVVLALVGYYRRSRTIRYVVLGMSLLYLGYLKGGGFSVHDAVNILQGDFPVLSGNIFWYALLAVIVVTTLLIGRFYCGWLCPFGALTEMLCRLFPRLRIVVPPKIDRWLRLLKYLVLLAILLMVVMVGQRGEISLTVDFVEPFGTTFQLNGTWFAWVILSLFLVGSVFISRVYCRYVCPLGAFFALVAMVVSLAHRAISRTPRTAPHPRSLLDRCPVDAIGHERYYADMGTMNGECIVCSRRTA